MEETLQNIYIVSICPRHPDFGSHQAAAADSSIGSLPPRGSRRAAPITMSCGWAEVSLSMLLSSPDRCYRLSVRLYRARRTFGAWITGTYLMNGYLLFNVRQMSFYPLIYPNREVT